MEMIEENFAMAGRSFYSGIKSELSRFALEGAGLSNVKPSSTRLYMLRATGSLDSS